MMDPTKAATTSMGIDRLEEILDAYGANPTAWPADERSAALALIGSSPQARALRDSAAMLDRLLDAAVAVEPTDELRRRVLEAAPRRPMSLWVRSQRVAARLWPFGPAWKPATTLAAAAVLGLVTGTLVPATEPTATEQDVTELAFAMYADVEEAP